MPRDAIYGLSLHKFSGPPDSRALDLSQRLMINYVMFGEKKEEKWTQKRCWCFSAQWL